jgi:hypothetical protein
MANITSFRDYIKTEDVQFRSSVSEAVGNKIGASINMINDYQHNNYQVKLNGPYSVLSSPQIATDGVFICDENVEIYAIDMYHNVVGSSGTFELDIIRHTYSGDTGSTIFSTRPALPFSCGAFAYLGYRFSDSTITQNPSGCTLPTLISINLNRGDMLTCNITSNQVGGQNAGITIKFRPRN